MKNSKFFVFGVDENIESIKSEKVKLIILPKDINEKYISEFVKLKEKHKITIIYIDKKRRIVKYFF